MFFIDDLGFTYRGCKKFEKKSMCIYFISFWFAEIRAKD